MEHLIKFLNKDYIGRFGGGGGDASLIDRGKKLKGPKIEYNLNKFLFRSKELKDFQKENMNILYSGCSNTWGDGVFEEEMWTNILTNKIETLNLNKKIDSNNIAYPGSNVKGIIKNLLGTTQKIGLPNYIFICFPSITRDLFYSKGYAQFFNCFVEDPAAPLEPVSVGKKYNHNFSYENNLLTSTTMIFLLEELCKSSNIKLFWTTWDDDDDKIFQKMNFNNYFKINYEYENKAIKTNSPYWEVAQDGFHPGAKWHAGIAEYMFDILKNEK
jgi:hypothetical protein